MAHERTGRAASRPTRTPPPQAAPAPSLQATPSEREAQADHAADLLLRGPFPAPAHAGTPRPLPSTSLTLAAAPRLARDAVARGGRPLPADVLQPMQAHFGHSLAAVRVHDDADAQRSALRLGALAYTLGRHVVFAPGQYAPRSPQGRHLLAHELAHVVQASGGVQRKPNPKAASQLADPISVGALAGYGFYTVGPEFSAQPGLADVQRVLAELGISDTATLAACTVREFTVAKGNMPYFAFVHPSLGVVARAGAGLSGYVGAKKEPRWSVSAFVDDDSATVYRPVGGTGELRSPVGLLADMSAAPVLSLADLQARVQLIEQRLAAMNKRYSGIHQDLISALLRATIELKKRQPKLTASAADSLTVQTALQLLEWVEADLLLLDQRRTELIDKNAPVQSVDALRVRYADVIDKLFDATGPALFLAAQQQAEQLAANVTLDALEKAGRFSINGERLPASQTITAWTADLRTRIAALYRDRDKGTDVRAEAEYLELAMRGLHLYTQRLVVWVQFFNNRPGITDTPLIDAMNRLHERVEKIKTAYDLHDAKVLKQRVESMEQDPNIETFYKALPAAMQVTGMIARVGVTTLAAMATGGVGGLISGGARTAATGFTLRGAATFVGTAALEAATFTAVNTAASAVVFGDKPSLGSVMRDFAWNLGLFTVLKGVSGLSSSALRAVELQALSMPVNLTVGFPFAHGWGLLRFRVENNRWPTKAEIDQMTAESLVMLAAMALGSAGVARWLKARAKAGSLSLIQTEYVWRFDALEAVRTKLGGDIRAAEVAGMGNDKAELASARAKAETLEAEFRKLLEQAIKDKRFKVAELREELNALREKAPDIAAQLMTDVLGVPADALVRRAGPASYTYANAKTGAVEDALSTAYRVDKSTDPKTGLKTVTATAAGKPTLVFQERGATLDFDTGVFDVSKLMLDLKITSPAAQKMMWRLLQEEGMSLDPVKATKATRQRVKELIKRSGKGADEADAVLADMNQRGVLGSTAAPDLIKLSETLRTKGILSSPEWLDARGLPNQRGVVGEWLARETLPPGTGQRVLRRVTVQGDLFEDAAGTVPAKNDKGAPRVGATVAETDLVYVSDNGANFDVNSVVNVKASGEKGMAASAKQQNANFDAVLRGKPGDLVKVLSDKAVRHARVTAITGLDGGTVLNLAGRLKPTATMTLDTVGPKDSAGFTKALTQDKAVVKAVTELLAEQQLVGSGQY